MKQTLMVIVGIVELYLDDEWIIYEGFHESICFEILRQFIIAYSIFVRITANVYNLYECFSLPFDFILGL